MMRRLLRLLVAAAIAAVSAAAPAAEPVRPRVIVLTDIGNEPDDSESLVRFLLYANDFEVEGLVASTSTWQRDRVRLDLIQARVAAYGRVRANLARHAPGYPSEAALAAVTYAGCPRYGMACVGAGRDTAGSRAIAAALARRDARPLWVLAWGGAADLAQALSTIERTRPRAELARALGKLRVYSISDQDDAEPWLRRRFPGLFWIASIHGWGQYNAATWSGISGDRRSEERWPDRQMVGDAWLSTNIRRGPLGALYPLPAFIMEGDSPSFLYLVPNGLGVPERPDYGSWGGRYMRSAPEGGHFGDVKDSFVRDGTLFSGNQGSIYRFRAAFQNDFAARIAWTITPDSRGANHPPVPVVAGRAGTAPVRVTVRSGGSILLDAAGTSDPDGDRLSYRWWQYREVGGIGAQPAVAIEAATTSRARVTVPAVAKPIECHIVLEVTDDGSPPLTRYRRIVLEIRPEGA